jgi:hypothetical protein
MNKHLARPTLTLLALALGALTLSGCLIRPTHQQGIQSPTTSTVVVQQQPAPVIVEQPAPVVVQQPAPVIVQQPITLSRPSPVLHPVRVSVPAQTATAAASNGVISYPHQRVRYPLHISYHQTVRVYVDGQGLDPTVAILDQYGRRLGFDDDGGSGLDSQLILTLSPGSYFIEIAGYSSSTGAFTLTVN